MQPNNPGVMGPGPYGMMNNTSPLPSQRGGIPMGGPPPPRGMPPQQQLPRGPPPRGPPPRGPPPGGMLSPGRGPLISPGGPRAVGMQPMRMNGGRGPVMGLSGGLSPHSQGNYTFESWYTITYLSELTSKCVLS